MVQPNSVRAPAIAFAARRCRIGSDAFTSDSYRGRIIEWLSRHELERDLLDEYLTELDGEFGEVPPGLVEQVDGAWPS